MKRLSRSFLVVAIWTGLALASGGLVAQEARDGLRLTNPTDEVVSMYQVLSQKTTKEKYGTLSNSMKQDLWSLHLSRALVELPELTLEQRAVILQGLGLVARGALGAKPGEADWEDRFGDSMRYFESQATELLPRELAIKIFARLGAHVDLRGPAPKTCAEGADLVQGDEQKARIPICSCATQSDWCDFNYPPSSNCSRQYFCLPTTGCGFLFLYDCDGVCGL